MIKITINWVRKSKSISRIRELRDSKVLKSLKLTISYQKMLKESLDTISFWTCILCSCTWN